MMKQNLTLLVCLLMAFSVKAQWTYDPIPLQPTSAGSFYFSSLNNTTGGSVIHEDNAGGSASLNTWSTVATLPFTFDFYGTPFTQFCVSKNRLLTFTTTVAGTTLPANLNDNSALPNADLPDNTIAYLWGNFADGGSLGSNDDVHLIIEGTAPNRHARIVNFSYKIEGQGFSYNTLILEEGTNNIYLIDGFAVNANTGTYTLGLQQNATQAVSMPGSPSIPQTNTTSTFSQVSFYSFLPKLLVNDDAGVSAVVSPVGGAANPAQSFEVEVSNFGINNLGSFQVNWSIDGVAQTSAPTATYTGPALTPSQTTNVVVGTGPLTSFPQTYRFWTTSPNGNTDGNTLNDTLEATLCGGISGTYTVGTPTSDFPTIDDALTALRNCGVSGDVTMQVAPGTYNQQVVFEEYLGVGPSARITFDGGSAATTTISHDEKSTVLFSGADYITIKNFTIVSTETSDSYGVRLENQANHNEVLNNIIDGQENTGSDRVGILANGSNTSASTEADAANNVLIKGNYITGWDYGIRLEGLGASVPVFMKGMRIDSNTVVLLDAEGILVDNQDDIEITRNVVEQTGSFDYGIWALDIMNFKINSNRVNSTSSYGIYVSDGNFDATPTMRGQIINNMATSGNNRGLYLDDVENTDVYHNSCLGEPGFYVNDGDSLDVRNNIFASTGDYAYEDLDANFYVNFDYNIFYNGSASNDLIKFGTPSFADLAAFQAANATLNVNSVEGDPSFTSATDLHIALSFPNDIGDATVGVLVDIDGEVRPATGAASVDIGADEFTPPLNDAGVVSMISPTNGSLPNPTQTFEVSVQNFGLAGLDSVQVYWSIDGVLQPSSPLSEFTGPTLPTSQTAAVVAGVANFSAPLKTYRFWTDAPNGTADLRSSNDTLEVTLCPGLSGTYTVGTPTSDFATIDDALDALRTCGVGGNVTMEVAPGTYTQRITFETYTGVGPNARVTFDGVNPATTTITHDTEATIVFDDADYVTIKNFTITTTETFDAFGVHFKNGSEYCEVLNNILDGQSNSGSDRVAILSNSGSTSLFSGGEGVKYGLIKGNQIMGWQYGIYSYGDAFPSTDYTVGLRIDSNSITQIEDECIYVYAHDSIEVTNNYILQDQSTFDYASYFSQIRNFKINSNQIISEDYRGLYITGGNSSGTPARRGEIINNMAIGGGNAGIYLSNVDDTDIFHNTTQGEPGIYLSSSENLDIRNNIFTGVDDYAYEDFGGNPYINFDYNLFYNGNSGSDLIRYNGLYADLASFQTANPTLNTNSVEGNPDFIAIDDLHINASLSNPANDAGDPTVGVIIDIDGEVRPAPNSASVDMGADEAVPPQVDAGVSALLNPTRPITLGFNTIEVEISNFGIDTITSVDVAWELNGVAQTTVTYPGSPILSNNTNTLDLGIYNLPAGINTLRFWTTNPNNTTDDAPKNDTLEITLCETLAGTYTVGTPTSDFATIDDAVTRLVSCGISAPVTFEIAAGTYNTNIVLPNNIFGVDAANTVTFRGASAATTTITHDASVRNATILLNGADYMRFVNLTVESTTTGNGRGFQFMAGADHNLIDSCIITTAESSVSSVIGICFSADEVDESAEGNNANYNTVRNTTISGGETAVRAEGSAAALNVGNTFERLTISKTYDYGMYFDDQDSLNLLYNTITPLGSTFGNAIYLSGPMAFVIEGNQAETRDYALYIFDGNANGSHPITRRGRVANNMFISSNDDAMYMSDVHGVDIWNNSAVGDDAGLYLSNPDSVDIRNNILVSTGFYALYCNSNPPVHTQDYNLFYRTNAGSLIYFASNAIADLPAWLAAQPNYDRNSVEMDPEFNSATDLHINGVGANDLGTTIASVTTDIDDEPRPQGAAYDIGADEYTPDLLDATPVALFEPNTTACGDANQEVRVIIRSEGVNAISNTPITVNVSGPTTATLNATSTATLAVNEQDTVLLGTVNTTAGGTFTFEIITTLANDDDRVNDTLVVTLPITPNVAPVPVHDTTCVNTSAELTVQAIGSAALDWYDVQTGGTPIATTNVFTTPALTSNAVYYVESQSCNTTRVAVNAVVVAAPVYNLGRDTTICTSVNLPLGAVNVPNTTYLWSTGATTAQITASQAGTYTVEANFPYNCIVRDTIVISNAPEPTRNYAVDDVSCNNASDGAIDLTISGGQTPYTFAWSNSETTEDITGLAGGAYYLTITDGTCTYIDTVEVTNPAVLAMSVTKIDSASCNGAADGRLIVAATGGTAPFTYTWSTGANGDTLKNVTAGTYAVTVTDANGCTTDLTQVLSEGNPMAVAATVVDESALFSGSITLSISGGVAPYQIVWSNGATAPTISNLASGSYTVTVTDARGCTFTGRYTVDYLVSVEDVEQVAHFELFPNPTDGIVNIQLELKESADIQLDIYTLTGQRMRSIPSTFAKTRNFKVDLSDLAAGVYFARFTVDGEVFTQPITVKR